MGDEDRGEGLSARPTGTSVVQVLNLGSTASGEVLSPGQPQFPHLEMGIVTQLHRAAMR